MTDTLFSIDYFLNMVIIAISMTAISIIFSTTAGIEIANIVPASAPSEPVIVAQRTVLR